MAEITNREIIIPLKEETIQFAVYYFTMQRQQPVCIPNIMTSYRLREADVFSITRAGYGHEFEIKCTTGDFRAEFINKTRKHSDLSMRFIGEYSKSPAIPNYYWFVAKKNIIPIEEIPEYAGLIEIKSIIIYNYDYRSTTWIHPILHIVKNAPLLHRSHFDIGNDFTRKLTTKYWNLNEKYLIQKYGDGNG